MWRGGRRHWNGWEWARKRTGLKTGRYTSTGLKTRHYKYKMPP
jgi:hypothetical protein